MVCVSVKPIWMSIPIFAAILSCMWAYLNHGFSHQRYRSNNTEKWVLRVSWETPWKEQHALIRQLSSSCPMRLYCKRWPQPSVFFWNDSPTALMISSISTNLLNRETPSYIIYSLYWKFSHLLPNGQVKIFQIFLLYFPFNYKICLKNHPSLHCKQLKVAMQKPECFDVLKFPPPDKLVNHFYGKFSTTSEGVDTMRLIFPKCNL